MKNDIFINSRGYNQNAKLITRSDLIPITNLKEVFRNIRDYFAGNVTGITRDETIAQNIIRILLCKIYDEKNSEEAMEFSNRPNENLEDFKRRMSFLFEKVKKQYSEILDGGEKLEIPTSHLYHMVSLVERYSIIDAERDVIGDAFEELIGTAFRGGEGQFFTPRNVVKMMVDVLEPNEGEIIIDPACGSGGFLAYVVNYLQNKKISDYHIKGIDKDAFLAKIAKVYLSLLNGKEVEIFCENSLEHPSLWKKETKDGIPFGGFDLILTNPPFGAKIPVIGEKLLSQYSLGRKWETNGALKQTNRLLDKQAPQVLFIERCLQLLKNEGRMAIVLPEGLFGNPTDKYIWNFVEKYASVTGVVSLAQETFQPSTHTKTSVLFLNKTKIRPKSVFMAMAKNVGHNKNGKILYKMASYGVKVIDDDLGEIAEKFIAFNKQDTLEPGSLGYSIPAEEISDYTYIPEYYNPEIAKDLNAIRLTGDYDVVPVSKLISEKIIEIKRGNEIGSHYYGTGNIPFVRTSDIVNWEIKFDPVKAVSEEALKLYQKTQDVQENDILLVNDGTFLIGRCAMVTRLDKNILIQSHLRKIRVIDKNYIDPYYLFYLLNSKIVKRQIESKTFVQATISTLGSRLNEVYLPICKNENVVSRIASDVRYIIEQKALLREKSMELIENSF